MKIKQLDIFAYGKWVQKTFVFDKQLQVISGPNESGKSTLVQFITSILYGFANKEKGSYSFAPKENPELLPGGRLYLEDDKLGEIIIERTVDMKKSEVTIFKADGTIVEDITLSEIVSQVSKEQYASIFMFNIKQLQAFEAVEEEQLYDYLLSIGQTGSDQMMQVARLFEKESGTIFKKQGKNPKLNAELQALEPIMEQLEVLKEQDETYQQLVQQEKEQAVLLEEVQQQLRTTQEKLRELDPLLTAYTTYEQLQELGKQKTDSDYQQIASNTAFELEQAIQQQEQASKELQLVAIELAKLDAPIVSDDEQFYRTHQEQIARLLLQQENVEKVVQQIEYYEKKRQDLLVSQQKQEQRFGVHKEAIPAPLLAKEQEQLRLWQLKRDELMRQKQFLHQKQLVLQEQHDEVEKEPISPSFKWWMIPSIVFGIGVVSFVWNSWVGIGLVLLSVVLGFILQKQAHIYSLKNNSQIKEQLKDIAYQLDVVQEQKQHIEQSQQLWWQQSIYQHTLISPEQLLVGDVLADYRLLVEEESVIQQQLKELYTKQQEYQEQLFFFWSHQHKEPHMSLTAQWRVLREFDTSMQIALTNAKHQQERKQQLQQKQQELEQQQQLFSKKQQMIYEKTATHNKVEFDQYWFQKEQQEKIRMQLEVMAKEIKPYQQQLEQFANKEELLNHYEEVQKYLQQQQEQYQEMFKQLASAREQIKQMTKSGSYELLLAEYQERENRIYELVVEWSSYTLAAHVLYRTLLTGKEDSLVDVIKDATVYFNRLTKGRYVHVHLHHKKQTVTREDGIIFDVTQLSQGTLDQLYIALRFAFIKHISNFVPMPVIIDDGFINFDDSRRLEMVQLVRELSEFTQVILVTFDEHLATSIATEHTIFL